VGAGGHGLSAMSILRFTHIGGPTTLIEMGGWRILTDPTFDPPGRVYRFGWGSKSRKTSPPAMPADSLGRIDVVLLTHEHHADNLDDAGRALLPSVDAVFTTMSGASHLGPNARGLVPWQVSRLEAPGRPAITLTATPCRHGPPASRPVVGDVIGFVLEWDGQENGAIWITGDTVMFRGVREVARRFDVGTAIAHLGRVRFPVTGPIAYTMGGSDLVELCRLFDPRTIVPVHYEGWSHFSQGRRALDERLARVDADVTARVQWVPIGEAVELTV
jgi:L-ascorbate metabolism protein UlaG (beta-lactamase superfamily)